MRQYKKIQNKTKIKSTIKLKQTRLKKNAI